MIIYITTNLVNGKKYIGRDSWNRPYYLGGGSALKKAIKKYGRENFKKEIIEECSTKLQLFEREEYWIKFYDAVKNPDFYNMTGSSLGWEKGKLRPDLIGRKHSDEVRARISKMGKGKIGKKSGKQCPVIQYRYEIIKFPIAEYENSTVASRATGISKGDIRANIRGEQKTAGGFIWEEK